MQVEVLVFGTQIQPNQHVKINHAVLPQLQQQHMMIVIPIFRPTLLNVQQLPQQMQMVVHQFSEVVNKQQLVLLISIKNNANSMLLEMLVDGMVLNVQISHVLLHLQLLIMMIIINAELISIINVQWQNQDKDVLKYQIHVKLWQKNNVLVISLVDYAIGTELVVLQDLVIMLQKQLHLLMNVILIWLDALWIQLNVRQRFVKILLLPLMLYVDKL